MYDGPNVREAFVGDGYGRNVGHGALGLGVTALYDQDIADADTRGYQTPAPLMGGQALWMASIQLSQLNPH